MPVDPPSLMPEPLRLTDVVRAVGGWPPDLAAVERLLHGADVLLPEERDTIRALTPAEVAALIFVASGLEADPAAALVDLARGADKAGFRALAQKVGIPRDAITTLWTRTRRRLGVPVTALLE